MEIAETVSRAKSEAESQAIATYRRLMTTQRPDGEEVPDDELAAVIAAMAVLNISVEESEADASAWKEVVAVTGDRDRAAEEVAKCGPEGDVGYREQIDNLDIKLAEQIDRLLTPKRVLLAKIACFDAAAEVLKGKESRLGYARTQVPRLCG